VNIGHIGIHQIFDKLTYRLERIFQATLSLVFRISRSVEIESQSPRGGVLFRNSNQRVSIHGYDNSRTNNHISPFHHFIVAYFVFDIAAMHPQCHLSRTANKSQQIVKRKFEYTKIF